MFLYAIRLKGTDKYLPNGIISYGRLRPRGFTYAEPTNELFPRFFKSFRSANTSLFLWLAGKWTYSYSNNPEKPSGLSPKRIKGREKELMEIVKFRVIEVKNGKSKTSNSHTSVYKTYIKRRLYTI